MGKRLRLLRHGCAGQSSAPLWRSEAPLDAAAPLATTRSPPPAASEAARRWLRRRWRPRAGGAPDRNRHDESIHAFTLTFDGSLDWTLFGLWLTMLLNRHGEKVLRVKGMLNVAGTDAPVAIHGVQHLVHPPVHMAAWPDRDRSSRLVFIVDGIDRVLIERRCRRSCGCPRARFPPPEIASPLGVDRDDLSYGVPFNSSCRSASLTAGGPARR
jgi:G3E family GTPase